MLDDETIRVANAFGHTTGDAIRALRPGGPLDTIRFTLTCTGCANPHEDTLRGLMDSNFACTCGHQLDPTPLLVELARVQTILSQGQQLTDGPTITD